MNANRKSEDYVTKEHAVVEVTSWCKNMRIPALGERQKSGKRVRPIDLLTGEILALQFYLSRSAWGHTHSTKLGSDKAAHVTAQSLASICNGSMVALL